MLYSERVGGSRPSWGIKPGLRVCARPSGTLSRGHQERPPPSMDQLLEAAEGTGRSCHAQPAGGLGGVPGRPLRPAPSFLAPSFHSSSLPHLLVYAFGRRGCRFKSEVSVRSLWRAAVHRCALPCVSRGSRLPFAVRSRAQSSPEIDGAPGALPRGPGQWMTLHYGKTLMTSALQPCLITQATAEGRHGWGDRVLGCPVILLAMAGGRMGRRGQAAPLRWQRPCLLFSVTCLEFPWHRGRTQRICLSTQPGEGPGQGLQRWPSGSCRLLKPADS